MTVWKSNTCGNSAAVDGPPPERCPNCRSRCAYVDVTCSLPACGSASRTP